jgi:dTDP-4-amino-4,6-dideoxygalactose transaminase
MKLALYGGEPVRRRLFPAHRFIAEEEKAAVNRVLDSGVLSRYLGCWHQDFMGGPEVQAMEAEWASYFNVKHAIAVNSCTSGLQAALGAIGLAPGDEVLVPPYTMSATATAPLVYNAIPVFADIEEDCFCIDPSWIESRITPRTRAVVAVNLMGQPYDATALNAIAARHGLYVIEDCAQAPGARHGSRYAGTLADVGVFSLNYHKHIHCGEGGVVVTDNDQIADRVRLIRNHAESVVEGMGVTNLANMLGFNFRLTELQAAIVRCQLRKLAFLVDRRRENCLYLEQKLSEIPALIPPKVRSDCTHVYYLHAYRFLEEIAGVPRDLFIAAVKAELPCTELREAEGVKMGCGYVKPIYLQPLFQRRIVYGPNGFPYNSAIYSGNVNYEKGSCPVVERMHDKEVFTHELMQPQMTRQDLDDVAAAFFKVWENRTKLKI